jgi:UDP-N-acetylmuramoyl-L-alanyl-D-glutamate--2,6-diaminopimelate ligase
MTKKLSDLLSHVAHKWNGRGSVDAKIRGIEFDSRKVQPGHLFVALRGAHQDGHRFVADAVKRGAAAVVLDQPGPAQECENTPRFEVSDVREALPMLAAAWHDFPSRRLKCVAITGTNGKTTTSLIAKHLLGGLGKSAVIGSIYNDNGRSKTTSDQTTPEPIALHRCLSEMVKNRVRYCVMEVSSHGLAQARCRGIEFSSAVFTNLSQDHLDYHGDLETYFNTKKQLFIQEPHPKRSIIYLDDPFGARLTREAAASEVITYGSSPKSQYSGAHFNVGLDHCEFDLLHANRTHRVKVPLGLIHNTWNALAAIAIAHQERGQIDDLINRLVSFPGVPGRLERIDEGQDFQIYVDYAHTPDAMLQILSSVRSLTTSKIITVFGCGGDRDQGKRQEMGKVASEFSDVAILTSDNSRGESPKQIMRHIKAGIDSSQTNCRVIQESGRSKAIQDALEIAKTGDVVLVLGKGHETYQIVNDQKIPFSDQETIKHLLRNKCLPLGKSLKSVAEN